MKGVVLLVERQLLELTRDRGGVFAVVVTYGLVAAVVAAAGAAAAWLTPGTARGDLFAELAGPQDPAGMLGAVFDVANFLAFSQVVGTSAVYGAHAIQHERAAGTWTHLLARMSPSTLLGGLSLGAMWLPTALGTLLFGGTLAVAALVLGSEGVLERSPWSGAWWVGHLLGIPTWSGAVAATAAAASAFVRDPRSAQQVAWLVVFVVVSVVGPMWWSALASGAWASFGVAVAGAVVWGLAVTAGGRSGFLATDE